MQITAATPIMIPSMVSRVRNLFRASDRSAMRITSLKSTFTASLGNHTSPDVLCLLVRRNEDGNYLVARNLMRSRTSEVGDALELADTLCAVCKGCGFWSFPFEKRRVRHPQFQVKG